MHYTCTLYSCTSVALELVYCTHIWPNYSHKLDFKELGESSSTRLLLDWGSSTLVREHICSWKNTVLKRSMLFLNLFSSSRLTESYFFRGWSVGLIVFIPPHVIQSVFYESIFYNLLYYAACWINLNCVLMTLLFTIYALVKPCFWKWLFFSLYSSFQTNFQHDSWHTCCVKRKNCMLACHGFLP